jgi:molecular chaperone GrpE
MPASEETSSGPVIHDHRRIDPVTGQVRGKHAASKPAGTTGAGRPAPPAEAPEAASGPGEDKSADHEERDAGETPESPEEAAEMVTGQVLKGGKQAADLVVQLAERTADVQRLQAEYANYRKRVERDRVAVREQALANVLSALLPVLDDIGRAREHGELTGGFKSVGESLETTAAKLGLESFGDAGEPFDPRVHEALMHSYSPEVTEPTAVQILQPGYKVGDRIIRPARVAVAEPTDGPGADHEDEASPAARGSQQRPDQPRGNPAGNN